MELWAVSRQAMEIGEELEEIPAWLMEAASDVAELGLWAALEPEAAGAGVVGSRVSSLRLGLRDVRLRRQGALADSLAALSVGLQGESLPGRADDFLALHRANALRTLGRYRDAAAVYEQLALAGAGNSGRERYWAADRAYLDGSFQAALESLSEVESGGHLRGDALLLAGHVHRVNALFGSALAAYRRALELARQTGSPSMEARALTGVAQTLSWTHPKRALKWTRRALISNRVLGNQVEVVKAHLGLAVAATGAQAWEEAGTEIEAARALAEAVGYQGGLVTADIAEAFQALVAGRTSAAGRLYRQVEEATTRLGGKAFWLDVLDAWMGASAGRRATWLGGPQAASTRWTRVLQRRQARSPSPLRGGSGRGY
jgi:tetratricopeptide (TPR) repeat protein